MPHERDRLFKLIEKTGANGVIFLSGDVHFTELSKTDEGPYPLYDFTSSGLAQRPGRSWYESINSYRLTDKVYTEENFGLVKINWAGEDTQIVFQARTVDGEVAYEHSVALKDLQVDRP